MVEQDSAAAGVQAHRFADDGAIPNNPELPLLVYPQALDAASGDLARGFEELFAANGWGNSWRNGIFPFPHYHSGAHEVLGIARGEARVRLGGEHGIVATVRAGDAVLIPAGVGHQNLGASPDLLVIGAYPAGQRPDLCHGETSERPRVLAAIAAVARPAADPVRGGSLDDHWPLDAG